MIQSMVRAATSRAFGLHSGDADLEKSLTLRSRTNPGTEPVTVNALAPPLTQQERLGVELGSQKFLIQMADLGSFVVDGGTTVEVEGGGTQYQVRPEITRVAGSTLILFAEGA